jgi:hypothetical protein
MLIIERNRAQRLQRLLRPFGVVQVTDVLVMMVPFRRREMVFVPA